MNNHEIKVIIEEKCPECESARLNHGSPFGKSLPGCVVVRCIDCFWQGARNVKAQT